MAMDHSHGLAGHGHDGRDHASVPEGVAIDPVCGMSVEMATAEHKAEHGGTTYYFCSAGCRTKFIPKPGAYLDPTPAKAAAPAPQGTIYTCPMHPDVRQEGPGSCPICGMALEPEMPTADTGPSAELVDMTRRFWVAAALSVPVLVIGMGGELVGLSRWIPGSILNWVQLVLATPVVLWAGLPFFARGWASIANRSLNMFTLIAMGVGIAWLYSVVATVAPQLFPCRSRIWRLWVGRSRCISRPRP